MTTATSYVVEALDYQWGWLSYSEWQEAEPVLPVDKQHDEIHMCMQGLLFK
jgi:hypothetical protein